MQKSRLKLLSVLITVILLISSSSYALEGLQEKEDNFFVSTDPAYEKLISDV
jgi:hypothetical protein